MYKNARILISEGSSLSSRQTITALGMAGYRVDLCTADILCISRFSKYVDRLYLSPAASHNPRAYMDFVQNLLRTRHYDVLLPTTSRLFCSPNAGRVCGPTRIWRWRRFRHSCRCRARSPAPHFLRGSAYRNRHIPFIRRRGRRQFGSTFRLMQNSPMARPDKASGGSKTRRS